jgi:hypothetical protein
MGDASWPLYQLGYRGVIGAVKIFSDTENGAQWQCGVGTADTASGLSAVNESVNESAGGCLVGGRILKMSVMGLLSICPWSKLPINV